MHTPRRVVSLSPNVSMILFALGADAVVVGRTQDCLSAIQQYLRCGAFLSTPWHSACSIGKGYLWLVPGHWQTVSPLKLSNRRPFSPQGRGRSASMMPRRLAWRPMRCSTLILGLCTTWISIQQIGVLLSKTQEAARVTAQLALRCDEAQARSRTVGAANRLLGVLCVHTI